MNEIDVINRIQKIMNHCIYNSLENYKRTFYQKEETKTNDEKLKFEQEERDRVLDELLGIYEKCSPLCSLKEHIDDSNFIQKSGFIYCLSSEDRDKWLDSHHDIPTYEEFCKDKKILDNSLPYFSVLDELVVKERYVKFLKERIMESREKIKKLKAEKEVEKVKIRIKKHTRLNSKTEKLMVKENGGIKTMDDINKESGHNGIGNDNTDVKTNDLTVRKTFNHNLSNGEIDILARCVCVTEMFKEEVSTELLNSILDCKPGIQLQSNNNTFLVYFFKQLEERGRIDRNWKDVIEHNKLFVGPKGVLLKASNLANTKIKTDTNKYKQIEKFFKHIPSRADIQDVGGQTVNSIKTNET